MGANATTKVPSYAAGQVLTAADLSITNSGIPVFANATDRTNSFGGTGEKTLAEGQYAYLEDDDKTYVYDGSAWKEVGAGAGLTYVAGATFTAQTTVAFANSVFTSTYDNYLVLMECQGDSGQRTVNVQVRDNAGTKSAAGYYGGSYALNQNGTGAGVGTNGGTSFPLQSNHNGERSYKIAINVADPASATNRTALHGTGNVISNANTGMFVFGCLYAVTEAHTGLVFTFSAASTGSYKVYGYANS